MKLNDDLLIKKKVIFPKKLEVLFINMINKIFSVEELLEMPIISEGIAESIEKESEEEVKNQEELTNNEH